MLEWYNNLDSFDRDTIDMIIFIAILIIALYVVPFILSFRYYSKKKLNTDDALCACHEKEKRAELSESSSSYLLNDFHICKGCENFCLEYAPNALLKPMANLKKNPNT